MSLVLDGCFHIANMIIDLKYVLILLDIAVVRHWKLKSPDQAVEVSALCVLGRIKCVTSPN